MGLSRTVIDRIADEIQGGTNGTMSVKSHPEETTQESPETPEETQSVFTHMTSVTPIAIPLTIGRRNTFTRKYL